MSLDESLKDFEGKVMTPKELIETFGSPYLYLSQFCGFIKGDYRVIAVKQEDTGLYKVAEVYKP